MKVAIGGRQLSWDDYEAVVYAGAAVELSPENRVAEHRDELERQVAAGRVIYAVNTGYGASASTQVPPEAIARVQANTLRSHAQGVGEPAPEHIVRGQLLVKAQGYAQGPPAVREAVVAGLIDLLNRRWHPVVPLRGSQSASGDLVPNAHVGLALMGEGELWVEGVRRGAGEMIETPLRPEMKEGVALTNDCAFATAWAFDAVREARRLVQRTEMVAAMTLQALRGFPEAFDERLVETRPHPGAIAAAAHVRKLLAGSELLRHAGRPHDPYCLRCLPQVHGAIRDASDYARRAVEIELRSVGDNPLVFAGDGVTLSGGNFHGECLAIPLDALTLAMIELAVLSQRRTYHLVNPAFDVGLPPRLTRDPDAFGLLMLNTSASAVVSELKTLAAPASIESIAVDHMEDHVSMAAVAARKAGAAVELARQVAAIELACAAQALDFQGAEHASEATRELHAAVRKRVAFLEADRPLPVGPLEDLL